MVLEIARRLVGGVWITGPVEEANGGGSGISEITSDDESLTVTDPTGPTVDLSVAAPGGSQPVDTLTRARLVFEETAGAGTYTAEVPILAGGKIIGVSCFAEGAPWDADTALMECGDTANPDGFFTAVDLVTLLTNVYNGTTERTYYDGATPGASWGSSGAVGTQAYEHVVQFYYSSQFPGIGYPAGDTVTATVVTTGAGGTTGKLTVDVFGWGVTPGAVNAVKS